VSLLERLSLQKEGLLRAAQFVNGGTGAILEKARHQRGGIINLITARCLIEVTLKFRLGRKRPNVGVANATIPMAQQRRLTSAK
jgi:tRNA-dihydrouridine synthase